jgi:hypothetical protein
MTSIWIAQGFIGIVEMIDLKIFCFYFSHPYLPSSQHPLPNEPWVRIADLTNLRALLINCHLSKKRRKAHFIDQREGIKVIL